MPSRLLGGWMGRYAPQAFSLVIACFVTPPARAGDTAPRCPAAATAFVVGVTGGVMNVDLPDVNDRTQSFGTHARWSFEMAGEVRPWLECGLDVGFTMLGESDSLQAILDAQGSDAAAVVTHVQWLASARARWLRDASRWSPYVRGGAGMATLWTSAPSGLGSHTNDPAWCAGAGLEFYPHPRLLLRAEGTYIGQATPDGARNHVAASLGILYAMPWSVFGGES
jgi:opacity protein-like surface antigen